MKLRIKRISLMLWGVVGALALYACVNVNAGFPLWSYCVFAGAVLVVIGGGIISYMQYLASQKVKQS